MRVRGGLVGCASKMMSQAHTLWHDVETTRPVAEYQFQNDLPVSECQLQNLTFQSQNTSFRTPVSESYCFRTPVSESYSFRTPVSEPVSESGSNHSARQGQHLCACMKKFRQPVGTLISPYCMFSNANLVGRMPCTFPKRPLFVIMESQPGSLQQKTITLFTIIVVLHPFLSKRLKRAQTHPPKYIQILYAHSTCRSC